jgi:hypothetical protein
MSTPEGLMVKSDEQFVMSFRRGRSTSSGFLRAALCSAIVSLGLACATHAAAAGEPFAVDLFTARVQLPQKADHAPSSGSGSRDGAADEASAEQRFVAAVLQSRSAPVATVSAAPEPGAPYSDRSHGPTTYESQAALLRAPRLRMAE